MLYVSVIDITRDPPSAFAHPYDECVFLRARQVLLFDRISNAVLTDQPLSRRGIDQGHIDGVPMFPAELFESPVGHKRVHKFQLSG